MAIQAIHQRPQVLLAGAGICAAVAGASWWAGAPLALTVGAVALAALALVAYAVMRIRAARALEPTEFRECTGRWQGLLHWEFKMGGVPIVVQQQPHSDSLWSTMTMSLNWALHHQTGAALIEDATHEHFAVLLTKQYSQEGVYPPRYFDSPGSSQRLVLPIPEGQRRCTPYLRTGFVMALEAVKLFLARGGKAERITIIFARPDEGTALPTPELVTDATARLGLKPASRAS